jgi:PEP-CTERM motif-containing protein
MNNNLSILKAVFLAAALVAFSGRAQALTINGTDVGTLDTVMGAIASAQSGQAYEEQQLEAAILAYTGTAVDVTLVSNITINNAAIVSEGGNNYINVSPNEPGYYVLKFGTGNTGNDMFFMLNEVFLQYLAWSDAQLIAFGLPSNHVDSISHYTFGGTPTTVPEPATLILLGCGLVGLVAVRRSRRNR